MLHYLGDLSVDRFAELELRVTLVLRALSK